MNDVNKERGNKKMEKLTDKNGKRYQVKRVTKFDGSGRFLKAVKVEDGSQVGWLSYDLIKIYS